jgi:hypothetical protein
MTINAAILLLALQAELPALEFSEINGQTSGSDVAAITCRGSLSATLCRLTRTSIAAIPFDSSMVWLNAETQKVADVTITWHETLWDRRLIEALTAKYGQPDEDSVTDHVNKAGGPFKIRYVRWSQFKDGRVSLLRGERSISLSVSFTDNTPKPKAPTIDF